MKQNKINWKKQSQNNEINLITNPTYMSKIVIFLISETIENESEIDVIN